MSSGKDRFASIESRIEIVMKMVVFNTILGIVEIYWTKKLTKDGGV